MKSYIQHLCKIRISKGSTSILVEVFSLSNANASFGEYKNDGGTAVACYKNVPFFRFQFCDTSVKKACTGEKFSKILEIVTLKI